MIKGPVTGPFLFLLLLVCISWDVAVHVLRLLRTRQRLVCDSVLNVRITPLGDASTAQCGDATGQFKRSMPRYVPNGDGISAGERPSRDDISGH